MNASDVLKYGHGTVTAALAAVPPEQWETPGVCGVWSVKNIVAHLTSFEAVLVDVLAHTGGGAHGPALARMLGLGDDFNDREVDDRSGLSAQETLAEYVAYHERTMALVADIPTESLCRPGTIPWYGAGYALDDLIVYMYYGHKREHMAQVDHFRDQLRG